MGEGMRPYEKLPIPTDLEIVHITLLVAPCTPNPQTSPPYRQELRREQRAAPIRWWQQGNLHRSIDQFLSGNENYNTICS